VGLGPKLLSLIETVAPIHRTGYHLHMPDRRDHRRLAKGEIDLHLSEFSSPVAELPEEERNKVFLELAAKHQADYAKSLQRIDEITRSINPLHALSHFAFYDLLFFDQIVEPGGEYRPLKQPHFELLQAFFLSLAEIELSSTPGVPPLYIELADNLITITQSFSLKRLSDRAPSVSVLPVEWMRLYTQTYRSRSYPEQTFRFLKHIFKPVDHHMARIFGLKATLLVEMVIRLVKKVEALINNRFPIYKRIAAAKTVEQVVSTYFEAISDSENLSKTLKLLKERECTLPQAQAFILAHYDMDLPKCFIFSVQDFLNAYPEPTTPEAIKPILNHWCLRPADLVDHKKEHFFLNNPIWKKPIIEIGENLFFWPLPQNFVSFGSEMIESLLERDSDLKNSYETHIRPQYLENEAERLFRCAFPMAAVLRGSIWRDPDTGKNFENDLLVLLDSFLIVIECKSGRIAPSARRGGQRLEVALKSLVQEPAEQSARFADFLLKNRGPHSFRTESGILNTCDTSNVHRLVRLSLTLDDFGPLACQSRLLVESGLVQATAPAAVTMPLLALETVFDYLENAHQKLHYLFRRSEWESHVDFLADEYDLLAFYLGSGFNVGSFEFEEHRNTMLYGLSEKLDEYSRAKEFGANIPKPALKLTQWWKDIMRKAQERAFDGWAEVGMFLLNVSHADQWTFEKNVNRTKKKFLSGKENTNSVTLITGPKQRQTAIAAYLFTGSLPLQKRDADLDQVAERVASLGGCQDLLVIGIDAEGRSYPYAFMKLAFGIN
jgi:hypothetical protein